MVTLDEAKLYLRVDNELEDGLITGLIQTSHQIMQNVSRLSDADFDPESPAIRIAILYAVAYLYEHRENPNYKSLTLTLRAILFGVREVVF